MTKSQLDAQIARHREQIDALCADLAACSDRAARIEKAARGAVSAAELIDRDRATDAGFLLALRMADALRAALEAP